jgi:hypothetical protein
MATRAKNTLGAALAVLALAGVAQAADSVPEITEQPRSVKRGEVVRVVWTGGSPDVAEAERVVVERRHGLSWRTEANGGTGRVLLDDEGDGVWSARWQPTYYSPVGAYRITVDGLTSDDFRVRPC